MRSLDDNLRVPWGRGYGAEGSSAVGEEAAALEDRLRIDPEKIRLLQSLAKQTNPELEDRLLVCHAVKQSRTASVT